MKKRIFPQETEDDYVDSRGGRPWEAVDLLIEFWDGVFGGKRKRLSRFLGYFSGLFILVSLVLGVHVMMAYEQLKDEEAETAAMNAWLARDCRAAGYAGRSRNVILALLREEAEKNPDIMKRDAPSQGAKCEKDGTVCVFEGEAWKCGKKAGVSLSPYSGN